jgi:hypothetical protein
VSGPTSDMLDGLARMLDTAGVAVYRPSDGATYAADETAISFKDLPPDPDRVVVITPANTPATTPVITYGQRIVQLRFRGTAVATDVDDLADAAFVVLHGAADLTFGSVHVTQILRFSSIPLGMDEQDRRWQRSDNYLLDVDWPTSANRPL